MTVHTAQSLILDKMTGLSTARHSAVVEYKIFYNKKCGKQFLVPTNTATNSLMGHTQYTPTQINIYFLMQVFTLLIIILFNNLIFIISTYLYFNKFLKYLYFNNINLLNHLINKNKF